MNRTQFYTVFVSFVGVILLALILWGPSGEQDKRKGYLWKKNWDRIEYIHLNLDSEIDGKKLEKNISFIRESHFHKDEYFVYAPDSLSHVNPKKREGNFNVKNIFTDWRRPEQKGFYEVSIEKLKIAGLDKPSGELRFYRGAKEAQIKIIIGKKIKNNNFLLEIQEKNEKPVLAVVPAHYVDKLRNLVDHYRSKRFLSLSSGDSIKEIFVTKNDKGAKGDRKEIKFHFIKNPKEDKKPQDWTLVSHDKKILPQNIVLPILGFVKQLSIAHFFDEKELSLQADSSWEKKAINYMKIRIVLEKGETVEVTTRLPVKQAAEDSKDLLLIRSNNNNFVDWAEKKLFEDIGNRLDLIKKWSPPKKNIKSVLPQSLQKGH